MNGRGIGSRSKTVRTTGKSEYGSYTWVLGINNFAIRKGHRYNTGLHNLRGGTFLDIIPGRTIVELQDYYQEQPIWRTLNPVAVVMDLAQGHHTFVKEMYPNAIRIADRFHVNRYVTDALQNMRKYVQMNPFSFCESGFKTALPYTWEAS